MNYKTLQTTFERELIFEIIMGLRKGKLSYEGSKGIAKAFLPSVEKETVDEFVESLVRLCRYFPEVTNAFIRAYSVYEKERREMTLLTVRNELKGGEQYGNN